MLNHDEEAWKKPDRDRGVVSGRACIFAAVLPDVRKRARELGYAIGLHGSMVRDLDLMAMPWAENAVGANELAHELQLLLGGIGLPEGRVLRWPSPEGHAKPLGRVAFTLRFGSDDDILHVDLSVMPPQRGAVC